MQISSLNEIRGYAAEDVGCKSEYSASAENALIRESILDIECILHIFKKLAESAEGRGKRSAKARRSDRIGRF